MSNSNGTIRKYVGETARSMGAARGRPAWLATPADREQRPAVFDTRDDARGYLTRCAS